MDYQETKCFEIFRACVDAIHDGELIKQVSRGDKEFHFQNWCQKRLETIGLHFEGTGRNIYPDFCLVERPEGYEIKGLAFPGREKDYDANSNVPSGMHKNKHIRGFGTYGDIMIRDRKMYVVPTPFVLTTGTAGLSTLILPEDYSVPEGFVCVGDLTRTEGKQLVAGYSFDLRTNEIRADMVDNPTVGKVHKFKAYRCIGQSKRPVTMASNIRETEFNEHGE